MTTELIGGAPFGERTFRGPLLAPAGEFRLSLEIWDPVVGTLVRTSEVTGRWHRAHGGQGGDRPGHGRDDRDLWLPGAGPLCRARCEQPHLDPDRLPARAQGARGQDPHDHLPASGGRAADPPGGVSLGVHEPPASSCSLPVVEPVGGLRLVQQRNHDDGEREYAYDRKSSIGRLERGLDEAD